MKVVLPKPATGEEIAEAFARTCEKLGLMLHLNTEYQFVPGSVQKEPLKHTPSASRHHSGIFGEFSVRLGEPNAPWQALVHVQNYDAVELTCRIPTWEVFPFRWQSLVADTTDYGYRKAEPHIELFLEQFFAELQ